jgi:hypothetical protein
MVHDLSGKTWNAYFRFSLYSFAGILRKRNIKVGRKTACDFPAAVSAGKGPPAPDSPASPVFLDFSPGMVIFFYNSPLKSMKQAIRPGKPPGS